MCRETGFVELKILTYVCPHYRMKNLSHADPLLSLLTGGEEVEMDSMDEFGCFNTSKCSVNVKICITVNVALLKHFVLTNPCTKARASALSSMYNCNV